ncbi:ABC transporter permease subunit [Actinomarinicola tropica]|uniref:ABC transporter permease subunit n=1 Tax=Actinomarinicola tropica TaxID=2789776 RepID=A0A5Q2RJF2_9ACTN|nr:ABC transporter permease subunit [Actinomarinicola tropica]
MRDELVSWSWISERWDQVWEATLNHLQLTVVAVGIGLLIAIALSAVALAWRPAYAPITWVTGFLYTIPSLALFSFLVPILGLGFVTAQVALVSYTLLILVRNIVAGVDGVPAAVKEAADGMGYTPLRRFVAVDLRLATPTIVAGIRIAAVTVVGLVTITALIGEGGYGVFILDGLRRRFSTPIVLGTVLSVLLAVAIDIALVLVERALTPWARRGVRH